MKNFLKKLPLLLALLTTAYFAACSNSSSSMIYIPPSDSSGVNYFSYAALSCRAYIGGSVIYNPDNSSLSQLSHDAKIAVRTSKLKKRSVSLYPLGSSSARDLRSDEDITVSDTGAMSGGTPEMVQDFIEEVDNSAVYGYIEITSVSQKSISFVYRYYPTSSSKKSKQSFSLKLGESAKLGGGNSCVKYEPPTVPRRGFENASYLTFVNSDESLTACMYSCMTELNSKPSSLYGVNSDGNFIYVVGNADDTVSKFSTAMPSYANDMLSYGDYIVDQNDCKLYSITGDASGGLHDDIKKSESDYKGGGSGAYGTENFLSFAYYKWQFPDPEDGPKQLFDLFPQSVRSTVDSAFASSSLRGGDLYVQKLNWILCDKAALLGIAAGLDSNKKEDADNLRGAVNEFFTDAQITKLNEWKGYLVSASKTVEQFEDANEDHVESLRYILDDIYDFSPDAYVDPPSLFNVYPDISIDLGDDGNQDYGYVETNVIPDVLDVSASKSFNAAKDYNEYVTKRGAIEKEFSKYHQLDLAKINGNRLSVVGVKFSLGVKGTVKKNLGITSGEFGIQGLGAALFLKAEANLKSVDLGEHSFFDKETQEKMKKDLHEPIKFNIGPVPFVYKTTFAFDFGWNAKVKSSVEYMAGFTAMFGGEIDIGAEWGVKFKWKVIPIGGYFNTWPTNKKSYSEVACYLGPTSGGDVDPGFDIGVYIKGTLTPQFGIGVASICAGFEIPCTAEPEVHYKIDNKTMKHLQGLLRLSINFGPFFEVTIPVIGKKVKAEWTAVKILDLASEGKAIEIFDVPM